MYTMYLLAFHTADSELSGMLPAIVTFPWSMIIHPIFDSIGYITWYDQFADNPVVYGLLALFPLLLAALINATILYFIGTWLIISKNRVHSS